MKTRKDLEEELNFFKEKIKILNIDLDKIEDIEYKNYLKNTIHQHEIAIQILKWVLS